MKVPNSKAACMSFLLMLISTGYRFAIRGEMHYSKLLGFITKMQQLYPITATDDQRAWAKKTGKYSAKLVIFPHDRDPTKVMFWLLATRGKAPKGFVNIHDRERLLDVSLVPLPWRDQFELRKEGRNGRKPTWTWCIRQEHYARLEASAEEAADAGAEALHGFFARICKMPMFSGIRGQTLELDKYAAKTWFKQRKRPYPQPIGEGRLPIMPKLKVFGDLTADILVQQMAAAEAARKAAGEAQAEHILEVA